MSCKEQQEEEVEVLQSIYEGDECYSAVNATTYQYKIGEDGNARSFVIEVVWGENYPEEVPEVNMDCFYNKHILSEVKELVIAQCKEEAEQNIGCAMTYTLFEWAKENAEALMKDQPLILNQIIEEPNDSKQEMQTKTVKVKKEQLTKAQKRKLTNQTNIKGERPRGWNWVDVVRHLSQTGKQDPDGS